MNHPWLVPDWNAPAGVHAVSTTRHGGVSQGGYESLNLGDHVGDDPENVARNREILHQTLMLDRSPAWLQQVHRCDVAVADQPHALPCEADAAISREPNRICVVMTADCLPVLFCDRAGRTVAAAHAGWRGLVGGVLENTVNAMGVPASELMAWMGPAIGPKQFEVGDEVRAAFIQHSDAASACFKPSPRGRWLADIYALARQRLASVGVVDVFGGDFCTVTDQDRFFSYRRDGQTGRMASLIWLAD